MRSIECNEVGVEADAWAATPRALGAPDALGAEPTEPTEPPEPVEPPARSPETHALVSGARAMLASAVEADGWTPARRREALQIVDRATAVLAAVRARLLTAEHAAGTWSLHGDKDLTAWRARTSRTGLRDAVGQVRQAQTITTMEQVEQALTAGAITPTHVDKIARFTAAASPAVADHARTARGQAAIVALATRVDGAELGRALDRWQAELDPAARQRTHDRQQAARYLNLAETPDGTHVKGLLDSVAGHRLRLALEAVTARPAQDDDRTGEQRRADALGILADRALDETPPAGPVNRPHVSVVLTEPTWRALRDARARSTKERPNPVGDQQRQPGRPCRAPTIADDQPSDAGRVTHRCQHVDDEPLDDATRTRVAPEHPRVHVEPQDDAADHRIPSVNPAGGALSVARSLTEVPPACDEDGAPWPASELGRLLCDCELTRIVVDSDGAPLDLGRTQRLFTSAQRRAVTVRDGGCGWPSCPAPARWCELHHIRWWDRDGGGTDVDNAIALCSYHHHQVHRRDLTITRHPPERPARELPPDEPAPAERGSNPPTDRVRARYRFTTPDGRDAITLRPPG